MTGNRHTVTFNKVSPKQDGDKTMIGDGASLISVSGAVLADTTQPSGQEYYKREIM